MESQRCNCVVSWNRSSRDRGDSLVHATGHGAALPFCVAPWFGINRRSKAALSEVFPWPEVKFEQRCIAAACAARGSVDFEMSMRRRTAAGSVPRTGSKLPVPIWLAIPPEQIGPRMSNPGPRLSRSGLFFPDISRGGAQVRTSATNWSDAMRVPVL